MAIAPVTPFAGEVHNPKNKKINHSIIFATWSPGFLVSITLFLGGLISLGQFIAIIAFGICTTHLAYFANWMGRCAHERYLSEYDSQVTDWVAQARQVHREK